MTASGVRQRRRYSCLPTAFFICAMLTDDFKRSWDRMNQQAERSQQQRLAFKGAVGVSASICVTSNRLDQGSPIQL